MSEGVFGLSWRARPHEEAAHFNPAFCGELLLRTLTHFHKHSPGAMPFVYAFLVLPLTLHPGSRRALPGRADTAFASWAGENAEMLSAVPDRVLSLRPVTREALLFLSQLELIAVDRDGINFGPKRMRLSAKPVVTTDETEEIRRTAGLLGRWFALQSDSGSVLQTMGVRV